MSHQTPRAKKTRLPRWLAWLADKGGATSLEWTLLLGAIAIPSYFVTKLALALLIGHYRMMTMLNGLPFP